MKFLKNHRKSIVWIFVAVIVLTGTYLWEDMSYKETADYSKDIENTTQQMFVADEPQSEKLAEVENSTEERYQNPPPKEAPAPETKTQEPPAQPEKTVRDIYDTEPVPEGKPAPIEPQDVTVTDKAGTCSLIIRCNVLSGNIEKVPEEKRALVPSDGIILAETTAVFYEGESVFNVLLRETRRNKIHMEYVNTPMYNSAYIEGINNLYEFDCGNLSGWMYSVNGWFPNYGSSRYRICEGDKIEWVYTCDLGKDLK